MKTALHKTHITSEVMPTEYQECLAFVDYLETLKSQGKILLYSHIPNETYTTSWSAKGKNRAMGVHKGFPDYIIITNADIVCVEMKRRKEGKVSVEQEEWIEALNGVDVPSRVCYGAEEAIHFVYENIL